MRKTVISLAAWALLWGTATAARGQDLESVLSSMDRAAASFRTAQCDFVWDTYQMVVDEHDFQKGTMYFRRQGQNVEMAANITSPASKYVLFADGIVSYYQPSIDQVTQYNAGKNRAEVESYLVLGFGGGGHALSASYDIQYVGMEQAQGVSAAKMVLTPKSQRVRSMFQTITLWIDTARGVSVQQKLDEPSGDYRLTKYSNIQINQKVPGDVFKLKTSGHTKFVKPSQ
ncbi:MAG TPA: outer membrane lipoprotein carrier protein LolA [Candidatus Binatia bacterium]|nr:outer membrane lipoprotein carrier protein LolA [Candidatus Binatia bacterium]